MPPAPPLLPSGVDWKRELAPLAPRGLTVILDVANRCNIRCRMCHFSFDAIFDQPARFMTPELFERIADELLPLAHTCYLSAASEPLTSPHFRELLARAARRRVPDLRFLTNALLLDGPTAEATIDAGVTWIQVSIDGARPSTYEHVRRGASFARLRANLERLRDLKRARGSALPRVQFNVTLMRSNVEELELFLDLAQELGVERIAARHVVPYAGLGVEDESLALTPALADRAFERFLARAARTPSVEVTNFPDFFGEPRGGRATLADRLLAWRRPMGAWDRPDGPELVLSGALEVSGWAVDRSDRVRVTIEREPLRGDRGPRVVATAQRHNATRPEVTRALGAYPGAWRAGWTALLEREALEASAGAPPEGVVLAAVARNAAGRGTVLGRRRVVPGEAAPHLYCNEPFDRVYVNAVGDVYPHPDCLNEPPYGSLLERRFADIWWGEPYRVLRRRIAERDAPAMCSGCPRFVNRLVDDPANFASRRIHVPPARRA